jgi:hypothetical protein
MTITVACADSAGSAHGRLALATHGGSALSINFAGLNISQVRPLVSMSLARIVTSSPGLMPVWSCIIAMCRWLGRKRQHTVGHLVL